MEIVDPHKIGWAILSVVLKPGPVGRQNPTRICLKSAAILGFLLNSILHVGDHLRTDVYGAKKNGFPSMLV